MSGPRQGTVRIGTSGWHYKHWLGPVYPRGTASARFLSLYAERFDTVEINNSFYRWPESETLATWHDQVPPDFRFACKANRYITHMKKLKDPVVSSARFFRVIERLGDKLGPILFQLPPRWRVDVGRLDAFLAAVPEGQRYAFEFRDESWFSPAVTDLLARHGAALCVYELAGRVSPQETTAAFCYLRLHGPSEAYCGSYDDRALESWAERIRDWSRSGKDVYVYFDNDEAGYAVANAERLKTMLGLEPVTSP